MLAASPLFSGSLFGGSLTNLLPTLEALQQTDDVISNTSICRSGKGRRVIGREA